MKRKNAGFSIIELMIVIGIIAIITTVSVLGLFNRRNKSDLDNVSRQMVAVLRRAQISSMNQDKGVSWGVHFENPPLSGTTTVPFYALFSGQNYSSTSTLDYYRLPSSVQFLSPVPGTSSTLIFAQITGIPSFATTTIVGLKSVATNNSTSGVTITSVGSIY